MVRFLRAMVAEVLGPVDVLVGQGERRRFFGARPAPGAP